jgi:hypothetical protein
MDFSLKEKFTIGGFLWSMKVSVSRVRIIPVYQTDASLVSGFHQRGLLAFLPLQVKEVQLTRQFFLSDQGKMTTLTLKT